MAPQEVPRSVSLPVSPESVSADHAPKTKHKMRSQRTNRRSVSRASTHSDSLVDLNDPPQAVENDDDVPSDMSYQSKSTGESDVDERGNPAACIFVASLTKGKNDEELNISVSNHFEQWGSLLNVKVLKDWMGRPYAFVQFERVQDAKMALQKAPGTLLDGRNIRCEPARVNRTLCITTCDIPLVTQEIESELATYGKIEDITILHGYPAPDGNAVNDCAYVKYCYRDDAVKAYLTLSKAVQKWWVEWASNLDTLSASSNGSSLQSTFQLTRADRTSVFVGNLFEQVTEDELRYRFSQYGKVVHLRIIRKLNGPNPRVFAFIRYSNEAQAKDGIQAENNAIWNEKQLRVSYREHRNPNLTISQRDLNRRMLEKPHPPGLGVPASGHQYLVSGESQGQATAHVRPVTENGTEAMKEEPKGKPHRHRHVSNGTHNGQQHDMAYAQQQQYMAPGPYHDPATTYANREEQQQQPMVLGPMQDAGTNGNGSMSAVYMPAGYYDYSGAYYTPVNYYPGMSYGNGSSPQHRRSSAGNGYYYMMAPPPLYQAPSTAGGPAGYVYPPFRGYSTPPQSPSSDRKEKRRNNGKKKNAE
ncbi:hypothetical protein BJV82DRAFT_659154 [Fennellomyces sp. T-0311]|nr:hypothetical protein BJV82DRAFT_659154 [Fennellomyces sp. T-0311]